MLSGSASNVQAILESQIFQRFDEDHASSIYRELQELIQTNQVRKLTCQREDHTVAIILTRDYVAGVWDAYQHHHQTTTASTTIIPSELVEWFVSGLNHWTESTISKESMQEYPWKGGVARSIEDALQSLLQLRVLLPDSSSPKNERYHLWLPQWGLVLKGWTEARQQLLVYVARKKEISERNVLDQNRHNCVATKFLLDELTHQGQLRIVQRPFGRFVQRVDKKEKSG
jgi:hypothetical protein